jgi:hypothetical protein
MAALTSMSAGELPGGAAPSVPVWLRMVFELINQLCLV